jgi:predicted RNA-binding protein YlqC (UPF0109 family)
VIKKLFGILKKDTGTENAPADAPSIEGVNDLEHFVDYVVRALVDSPDQVGVASVQEDSRTVIQVTCAKEDIGKIIGKNGKTISAIRALVNGAGKRFEKDITVEVMD